MDKESVSSQRSAYVKRLEETVKGLNDLTVLKLRLEGAILSCDEFLKEFNVSNVSSAHNESPGGAAQSVGHEGESGHPA